MTEHPTYASDLARIDSLLKEKIAPIAREISRLDEVVAKFGDVLAKHRKSRFGIALRLFGHPPPQVLTEKRAAAIRERRMLLDKKVELEEQLIHPLRQSVRRAMEEAGFTNGIPRDMSAYYRDLESQILEEIAELEEAVGASPETSDEDQLEIAKADKNKHLREWTAFHNVDWLKEINSLSGPDFERFLTVLLSHMGYVDVERTGESVDQGADILCTAPDGKKVAVQSKRWRANVGNRGIQEILAAVSFYDCKKGLIITNSKFTQSAESLARRCPDIELCDGAWLEHYVVKYFGESIPNFDPYIYERCIKDQDWYSDMSKKT